MCLYMYIYIYIYMHISIHMIKPDKTIKKKIIQMKHIWILVVIFFNLNLSLQFAIFFLVGSFLAMRCKNTSEEKK